MNKSLLVILATVTLDAVGMSLIMPILPGLLRELTGRDQVAGPFGVLLSIYALMQFVFSPILGALSDRFGRRPVLLVSLAGAAVDYLVMSMTSTLSILYVGRIVAGITGANMAVATAYIADITPEEDRSRRYGAMNACLGLGFVAGPLLGGTLGTISPRAPFLLAAVLNGLNFLLGLVLLPESRAGGPGRFGAASLNPFASLGRYLRLDGLPPLLTAFFLVQLVGQVPATLWVIYSEDKFGWDAGMVGLSLAAFGIFFAVSQAFLTGPITDRFGERRSILLGLLVDGTGFLLMALATRGWMVFPILPFLCMGGIATPALQSLLSGGVGEEEQGELQGTLASLTSLSSIVGPLAVTRGYAASSGTWTGIVWVGGAALYLLCIPALRRPARDRDRAVVAADR